MGKKSRKRQSRDVASSDFPVWQGRDLMFSFSRGCLYYATSMPQSFLRLRSASLGGGRMLEAVCNDIA